LIDAFDAPDGSITTPQRNATTTPIQALLMINGPWTLARAQAFAARLRSEASDDAGRIDLAYRLAYARPPSTAERAEAVAFLHDQAGRASGKTEVAAEATDCQAAEPTSPDADAAALVDFCHALLNTSEFLYID
jgi:hypothetical protein